MLQQTKMIRSLVQRLGMTFESSVSLESQSKNDTLQLATCICEGTGQRLSLWIDFWRSIPIGATEGLREVRVSLGLAKLQQEKKKLKAFKRGEPHLASTER